MTNSSTYCRRILALLLFGTLFCNLPTAVLVAGTQESSADKSRVVAQVNVRTYERTRKTPSASSRRKSDSRAQQSSAPLDIVIGGENSDLSASPPASPGKPSNKANDMLRQLEQGEAALEQEASKTNDGAALLARLKAITLSLLKKEMVAFAEASEGLGTSESIDPAGLPSPEAIDQRLIQYRNLREQNAAMLTALKSVAPSLTTELRTLGIAAAKIDIAVDAAQQVMTLPAKQQYHEACASLCDSAISILQLLRKNWGHWVVDEKEKAVGFKPTFPQPDRKVLESALAQFQQEQEKMKRLEQSANSSGTGRPG